MMKSISDLSKKDLPSLPSNFSYLLNRLNAPDISMIEVVDCLGQFPDITARLMSLANSAWMSPTEPVESLLIACHRIGFNIIRSVSIAVSLASSFNSVARCKNFDPIQFWIHALMSADVTVMLAKRDQNLLGIEHVSIHTACVLRNIGLLYLAGHFHDETSQALALPGDNSTLSQRLKTLIGCDHHQVGGQLARHWHLPLLNTNIMSDNTEGNPDKRIEHLIFLSRQSSNLVSLMQINRDEELNDNIYPILNVLPEDYAYVSSKLEQTALLVKMLF